MTVCSQINLIGSHLKFERFAALRYCFLIPRIVSLTFKQGYTRFSFCKKTPIDLVSVLNILAFDSYVFVNFLIRKYS